MQVSEGVIHRGLYNTLRDVHNSSYPAQPHSLIAK